MKDKQYFLDFMRKASYNVRLYRRDNNGALPELEMTRDDWETVLEYWPRRYLSGPSIPQKRSWLDKLLRYVKPPVILTACDEAIENLRQQMRSGQAVLMDGVFIKVNLTSEPIALLP